MGERTVTRLIAILAGAFALLVGAPAWARVETIMVHGPSIEGNLEGNDATRKVHVILPKSYDEDTSRRFPVIYFLHGFTATADRYLEMADPDDAVQSFDGQEMIVVLPDSHTKRGGSFYASGPTVGDFETFIAKDLVEAIDARFRTIADRESRGLAGHSMGGYGTLRIGMKHPKVFSSIYPMAPCCTQPRPSREGDAKYETMDPDKLTAEQFWDYGYFAWSAAFSPNPQNPPYYWDLGTTDGTPNPLTVARWAVNSPAAMISQYSGNLKQLDAIAMDVGEQDFLLDEVKAMHAQLDNFGVAHEFMLFEGDHTNRVKERFRSQLLPFFASHLDTAKDYAVTSRSERLAHPDQWHLDAVDHVDAWLDLDIASRLVERHTAHRRHQFDAIKTVGACGALAEIENHAADPAPGMVRMGVHRTDARGVMCRV